MGDESGAGPADGRRTAAEHPPAAVAAPAEGGHALVDRFSSLSASGSTAPGSTPAPAATAPPRRRKAPWLLPLGAVLLLAAIAGALQLTANLGYDDARHALASAISSAQDAADRVERAVPAADDAADAAETALGLADPQLMTDQTRAALSGARDEAASSSRTAARLAARALPAIGPKPLWFWELNGLSSRFERDLPAVRSRTKSLDASSRALGAATQAVDTAGTAAAKAAGVLAADLEAANRPAPNTTVLEVRSVGGTLAAATRFDGDVAQDLRTFEAAVRMLRAGHDSTLAAEAGPLQPARSAIEDFARALAPGVLLDFEWADLVNDLGSANGYLSGETIWPVDDGQYSTIRLSNSVAEDWPGDSSKALVAHEVGHAITVKCRGMYDTSDSATAEAWATAWAISMGFTDDGNGTQAYGAPPESLIATASGCR